MYVFEPLYNVFKNPYSLQTEQIESLQQQITMLEQEKTAMQEIISASKENVVENPIKVSKLIIFSVVFS